jgi:hypothetical protein
VPVLLIFISRLLLYFLVFSLRRGRQDKEVIKSFVFDGCTKMSVEHTLGVAGLKFVAYFAPFTNVTYYLSEDPVFWKVVHFVISWH